MERKNILAITDTEFYNVLKKYSKYDDLMEGKLFCFCCGEKLDISTILGFNIISNDLKIYCNRLDCKRG